MTARQRRFVAEYLKDLNATQAAIRAGYSAKTARAQGSENMTKPDIAAAIAAGQERQLQRAELSAIATKEAIRRQVESDVRRLFDDQGNRGRFTRSAPRMPHSSPALMSSSRTWLVETAIRIRLSRSS
jgi:phage terminase small subunit